MRKITVERLAEFTERDYQLAFGISKDEFDQMLAALEEAYAREHKRKPRFTKITIKDKLILTLIYRHEYRSMDSVANEYEVSRDTIADNVHWVEQTLLNADLLETSVTCVYKTNCSHCLEAEPQGPGFRAFFICARHMRCTGPQSLHCTLNFSGKNSKMMLYVS